VLLLSKEATIERSGEQGSKGKQEGGDGDEEGNDEFNCSVIDLPFVENSLTISRNRATSEQIGLDK